jgi:hypothetical protein
MPFQSATNTDVEAQSTASAKPSELGERHTATLRVKPEESPVTPREQLNFPDIFPVYPFL